MKNIQITNNKTLDKRNPPPLTVSCAPSGDEGPTVYIQTNETKTKQSVPQCLAFRFGGDNGNCGDDGNDGDGGIYRSGRSSGTGGGYWGRWNYRGRGWYDWEWRKFGTSLGRDWAGR
jgi:hypothetical protein